ncbi:hypothetical protein [Chitinophaga sp. OAE865]|uniref:hypothetical protein n=1 Tax=Chitinophaga sp. OAE865 TaxID=2817898 RepID=UPI001AE804B5
MKIKFTDSDPYGFTQNKFLKFSGLFVGILLVLLGGCGLVIDLFFPASSSSFHNIAGQSNVGRFLSGVFLLACFYVLRGKKTPSQDNKEGGPY